MDKFRSLFIFIVLVLLGSGASAQDAVRLRGTVTSFDGAVLSVKSRDSQDLRIEIPQSARISYPRALKLADLKPGTALGTTAVRLPDGKLLAREVHVFVGAKEAPNEGNRPMDVEPGASMTNATVSATVEATNGRELTLDYKGGSQQVVVPEDVLVFESVAADRSLLVAGEYVVVNATATADGRLSATRVQVSKDGVKPPL
jgi:hypothetical protein